jgi:dihydroneopterin aldolase
MNTLFKPHPAVEPAALPRVERTTVFIRNLLIEAPIGIYPAEQGRRQALLIDAELDITPPADDNLSSTVDYDLVAARAQAIADNGHIGLVETFARHLALACLRLPGVTRIDLTVQKPEARPPAMVGTRLVMSA